jgi:hypothetical protein
MRLQDFEEAHQKVEGIVEANSVHDELDCVKK